MAHVKANVIARAILLAASISTMAYAGPDSDQANGNQAFTTASVQGNYAVVGTYGANVARLIGTFTADGFGGSSGSARVNLPGPNGQRIVVPITFAGTYTVTQDGTGTFMFTVSLPNGATAPATLDFVITKAERMNGEKVATEFVTAQREPSSVVNGQFITHVATRRPD